MRFLIWPVPALFTWATSWGLCITLLRLQTPVWFALLAPIVWGVLLSALGNSLWRRGLIALGFPLSLLLSNVITLPTWAWLAPLALILMIYPLNAWQDAPLFPTPRNALEGLAQLAPLPPNAHIVDAGCGLGDGLLALHRVYPTARLHGIEWSWPLRLLCALRCRWARIEQGDIWKADWSAYQMVYLFQRPESMARAVEKARRELKSGAYLVSLEFEATALKPHAVLRRPERKAVWIYKMP